MEACSPEGSALVDEKTLAGTLVDRVLAEKAAQDRAVRVVGGGRDKPADRRMIEGYSKMYPWMTGVLSSGDPSGVMGMIDVLTRDDAGTLRKPQHGYKLEKLRDALSAIWGINAYVPQGFTDPNAVPSD